MNLIPPKIRKGLSLGAKTIVPLGVIVWIFWDLDFSAIAQTLRKFPPWIFALAVSLQILMQMCQALRWKILTGTNSGPYRDYLSFVSLGYVLALVSPSALLSDSANAWLLGKRNHVVLRSFSAMVTGRLLGMAAMSLFFLFALRSHLWVFGKVPWEPKHSWGIIVLALIPMTLGAWWGWKRYGSILRERWRGVPEQILSVFRDPRALFLGFVLSVCVQGLQMILSWMGYHAMEVPIPLVSMFFFAPLITLIGLLPISIGQVGVREGLSIFFFMLLPGVTKEQLVAGFGYTYALFAVMGLLNLLFAGWMLRKKGGTHS